MKSQLYLFSLVPHLPPYLLSALQPHWPSVSSSNSLGLSNHRTFAQDIPSVRMLFSHARNPHLLTPSQMHPVSAWVFWEADSRSGLDRQEFYWGTCLWRVEIESTGRGRESLRSWCSSATHEWKEGGKGGLGRASSFNLVLRRLRESPAEWEASGTGLLLLRSFTKYNLHSPPHGATWLLQLQPVCPLSQAEGRIEKQRKNMQRAHTSCRLREFSGAAIRHFYIPKSQNLVPGPHLETGKYHLYSVLSFVQL